MTHDSTLKSREYGVVLCDSLSGNDLVESDSDLYLT
jgi:hypothetical protein